MKLKHFDQLGEPFKCRTGTDERFVLRHLGGPNDGLSVSFTNGSVFLSRDRVADLATTLLFWLDQTDPDKEAE